MKLINSYLSKNILQPTIAIIAILSVIILLTQSLKYIDLMVSHGISVLDFTHISVLLLPSLLFIIIPVCSFIAIIYSLNKLSSHRELNILKGFGINNFAIAKPIFKIILLITIFHYFISLYWMPLVNHKFKDLTSHLKDHYITFFLQEKVFSHPTEYLTFYIKNKISDTRFEDIFFQDSSKELPTVIIAKKGEMIKRNNKVFLNLVNGNRQETNKNGELTVLYFDALLWQLSSDNQSENIRNLTIQEKHLPDLLFPNSSVDQVLNKKMLSEATHRILWPFYNIIFTMLAISAILQGEYNRSGKTRRIISFSIIAGAVAVIGNSLINLAATYSSVIFLCYLFTFGVFISLVYLLFYSEES